MPRAEDTAGCQDCHPTDGPVHRLDRHRVNAAEANDRVLLRCNLGPANVSKYCPQTSCAATTRSWTRRTRKRQRVGDLERSLRHGRSPGLRSDERRPTSPAALRGGAIRALRTRAPVQCMLHGGDDFFHRDLRVAVYVASPAARELGTTQGNVDHCQQLVHRNLCVAVTVARAGRPARSGSLRHRGGPAWARRNGGRNRQRPARRVDGSGRKRASCRWCGSARGRLRLLAGKKQVGQRPPALHRAIAPNPAAAVPPRAYLHEGTRRRRGLTNLIVTPARHRAVGSNPAGVVPARAYLQERTGRRGGLAKVIVAPALYRAVTPNPAGVARPRAYLHEGTGGD